MDELSDISDNSDLFHVEAKPIGCRTDEDKDLVIVASIALHLREYPLLPYDGVDPEKQQDFMDMHSGIRLPLLHCGFKGCSWTNNADLQNHWDHERVLFTHLKMHRRKELSSIPESAWPTDKNGCVKEAYAQDGRIKDYHWDVVAYYVQATCLKEQEHVPIIGPSLDRKMLTLMVKALNSQTVEALICFACANVHTHVRKWDKMCGVDEMHVCHDSHSAIQMHKVEYSLWKWAEKFPEAFNVNFNLALFKERYATDGQQDGNPFAHCTELDEGDLEWQREMFFRDPSIDPVRLLCCPEDVRRSPSCKHEQGQLCGDCEIPICNCLLYTSPSPRD